MKKNVINLLCLLCLIVMTIRSYANALDQKILSQEEVRVTVKDTIDILERRYLFPQKVTLASRSLQYKLATGELYQKSELARLQKELGELLRDTTGDSHIEVRNVERNIRIEHLKREAVTGQTYFGDVGVQIFEPDIGYLRIKHFNASPHSYQNLQQAMEYLSSAKSIIIDIRDADGDSVLLAQQIMSYFFIPNVKLAAIHYEQATKTEQLLSLEMATPKTFIHDYPLYILTSAFVSGAGEFLSYTLKHLDKAVIIGEPTMGVAHLSKAFAIGSYLRISLPYATTEHPVTKSNWEGQGVMPDYNVKASKSNEYAQKLARKYLQETQK